MTVTTEDETLTSEYENEAVPANRRRSLLSVASVWAGFPMIITGAVTGATLVNGLGFVQGLVAMLIGNALLLGYVGALSALSAKTGLNFSLQASRTFGRTGYVVCSALLSTLVLGWFAVQTGLVGASMAGAFPVSATVVALIAGVLFTLFTLLGIRALAIIGMVSVPLFLVLGIIAAAQASVHGVNVWTYHGTQTGSLALGVGVTLVFALFADSGSMTADFTRWAKTPRQALIATSTAFPIGNLVAMLVGGVIAAATAGSGDVFSLIAKNGGVVGVIAVIFLFVNLGSVCTHCLYNSAVGWSSILKGRMRVLTLILGAIGTVVAVLGIWGFFVNWLNLLGVIVPPIGAIIIADQLILGRASIETTQRVRWQPFVAWAIGSGLALVVDLAMPGYSTVIVGLVFSAGSYLLIAKLSPRTEASVTTVAS
ncbi:MAG: cytosine permease [Microbacteriaceae bacterium]|jgi:cytosine permease|nr:cytosine permease [Microbacteriaceae bacterium]